MSNEQMLKSLNLWLIGINYDFGLSSSIKVQELAASNAQEQLISQWELALKQWDDAKLTSAKHLIIEPNAASKHPLGNFEALEQKFMLTLSWAAHHELPAVIDALVRYCLPTLDRIRTRAQLPWHALKLTAGKYANQALWFWVVWHEHLTIFESLMEQSHLSERALAQEIGVCLLIAQAPSILNYVILKHSNLLTHKETINRSKTDPFNFNAIDYAVMNLQEASKARVSDNNFIKCIPLMLKHPYLGYPDVARTPDRHYIMRLLDNPQPQLVHTALTRAFLLYDALQNSYKPPLLDLTRQLLTLIKDRPLDYYPFAPMTKFLCANLEAIDREVQNWRSEPLNIVQRLILCYGCEGHESDTHLKPLVRTLLLRIDHRFAIGPFADLDDISHGLSQANFSFFEINVITFVIFKEQFKKTGMFRRDTFDPRTEKPLTFARIRAQQLSKEPPNTIAGLLEDFPKTSLADDIKKNLLCFAIEAGLDNWLEPLLATLKPNVAQSARLGFYRGVEPTTRRWGQMQETHRLNCFSRYKQTLKSQKLALRIKAQGNSLTEGAVQGASHEPHQAQFRSAASPAPELTAESLSLHTSERKPLLRQGCS